MRELTTLETQHVSGGGFFGDLWDAIKSAFSISVSCCNGGGPGGLSLELFGIKLF